MAKLNEVYKCNICGNIVEIMHSGAGKLVCCGQPMEFIGEKKEDNGQEKHVPILEKTDRGIKVRVGSVAHPMEQEHFIEWIELVLDGAVYRKFLKPGDAPETEFEIDISLDEVKVREYCSVHKLWES